MSKFLPLAVLVVAVCTADLALCQYYGVWGGSPHHASTAAESYARGMADAVRSQGQANLMNAQALGAVEDARSKYIDNRLRATQAYYDRKRIHDEYQEEKQMKSRYYLAKKASSLAPLNQRELDETTGKITWPQLLMQPQYDEDRRLFEEIFARRATEGVASNEDFIVASNRSKDWRDRLTKERDNYNFNELRDSILFIRRLVEDLNL